MEELDDYYRNKGGCDLKGVMILMTLTLILTLILSLFNNEG
jgi:hypothetical protein